MLDLIKTLVIIPARSGSKGVPGKNKKILAGKPLISYSIEAALSLFEKDQICVSTDDDDILQLCEDFNIKPLFKRPEELSIDTASSFDVLKHAIEVYEKKFGRYETIVLLQPTSPFRTGIHLKAAIGKFDKDSDLVVSVKETESNPYYVLFEENDRGLLVKSKDHDATRRQDVPKVYELNGAIYIINRDKMDSIKSIGGISKMVKFEMDDRSSIDIDTPLDWEFAEFLMMKQNE